jgi:tetratricopeptide (TPR) repeat protein
MRARIDGRYHSTNEGRGSPCNRRSSAAPCLGYGLTLVLVGCSVSGSRLNRAPIAPATVTADVAPSPARVPALIVTRDTVIDVEELFVAGQTHLRQGRPAQAAETFDSIVQHDPLGPFTERALFQGALAHESSLDLQGAAERFEQVERRFPDARRSAEALTRSMRVRLHLEQWEPAGDIAERFMQRFPAGPVLGRIVSYAARAMSSLVTGKSSDAEYFVAKGLDIVERLGLDRAGEIPRDLAPLYFAQGEARRLEAEATPLGVEVSQFSARLERRCQLLLAAQSAYSSVMRAHDAHWSTMAGYRVGELYERLHEEVMRIPPPRAGTPRERLLFEGAMRLRYSVLLDKASSMLEHTLAMAVRTGEDSEWVRRTKRSQLALASAVAAEQAALDRLPFSRGDLQKALDDLAARAEAASTGGRSPRSSAAARSAAPGSAPATKE